MSFHAWVDLVEGRMLIQKVSMCEFFRTISSADITVTEREKRRKKNLTMGRTILWLCHKREVYA
jgi:hypothetical protein